MIFEWKFDNLGHLDAYIDGSVIGYIFRPDTPWPGHCTWIDCRRYCDREFLVRAFSLEEAQTIVKAMAILEG